MPRQYHIADYGGVSDGVADDTASINAAINACYSSNGGRVFLGYGTHKVTSTLNLPTGVILTGMGCVPPWSYTGLGGGVAKAGSMIAWHGPTNGDIFNFGTAGATAAVFGAGLSDLGINGRCANPSTSLMCTALRFRAAVGCHIDNVAIQNVGYGVAFVPIAHAAGMLTNGNTIDGLDIFGCWRGLYFDGNGDDLNGVSAADSFFNRLHIRGIGPNGIGIDFVDWCDHNFFNFVKIYANEYPSARCIVVNSPNVADNGCSVIDFKSTFLVNGAGTALTVHNTHGTTVGFDGSVIGKVEIDPLSAAKVTIKDNSHHFLHPVEITGHAGSPVTGSPSTTPADLYTGCVAHFTYADWVQGSAIGGYTIAERGQILNTRVRKVEAVIEWNPGSATGAVQVVDETNDSGGVGTAALMAPPITPGSTGRKTTKIDVTNYVMTDPPGGQGYAWAYNTRRAKIQMKGNGSVAPVLYRWNLIFWIAY